jgi:predicted kinase
MKSDIPIIMNNIVVSKPLLILMYGYPGAGKTYFARQLCEEFQAVHIQGDRIRYELFSEPQYDKQENEIITHLVDYVAEEFLKVGVSVIYDYDVNSMRLSQRRILRDMARRVHAEPFLIWFQIDIESAFSRIANRDRRRIDDKYTMKLDRTSFDNYTAHMQNPGRDEDYIVVSGKQVFKTQFSSLLKHLREMNIVKTENNNPNLVKPGLVNLIPQPLGGRVDFSRRNIVIR